MPVAGARADSGERPGLKGRFKIGFSSNRKTKQVATKPISASACRISSHENRAIVNFKQNRLRDSPDQVTRMNAGSSAMAHEQDFSASICRNPAAKVSRRRPQSTRFLPQILRIDSRPVSTIAVLIDTLTQSKMCSVFTMSTPMGDCQNSIKP